MNETICLGTLRQFEIRLARQAQSEYGITLAEYWRNYPSGCRKDEWVREIWDQARSGGVLSRSVLDCLIRVDGERAWWSLFHDYPGSIPPGYEVPSRRRPSTSRRKGVEVLPDEE